MVQKNYACTHLDIDNNASSQSCIKWTVKYSIQAFSKSSSHLDRNHGYITEQ